MSDFKAAAEAIRHKGFDETAGLVDQLAAKKPKLFVAVSISQTGYGDEINGWNAEHPRVFLTRKSAKREAERLMCEYLRTVSLSDMLERFEMEDHRVDHAHVSREMTRILGAPTVFPAPGVEYWQDARCQQPLLPGETDDEKTLEIAELLKIKFFKVISVPCDANLTTPPPSQPDRVVTQSLQETRSHEDATQGPLQRFVSFIFQRGN